MPDTYHLYVDESGTRHPDRHRGLKEDAPGGWFGLGGLLIRDSDEQGAKDRIAAFRQRWPELRGAPFHSSEIRNATDRFLWLTSVSATRREAFFDELSELIRGLPIHCIACVVDRDGYNRRYMPEFGQRRWKLCKTAFSILLERSAKYALHRQAKLRVYVERSDKKTDNQMRAYYETLREEGLPFDAARSAQYRPLTQEMFKSTLYEFRLKDKASDLMQIADLVLWPLCANGYYEEVRAYAALLEAKQLVECLCEPGIDLAGTKYSCFEAVIKQARKTKARKSGPLAATIQPGGDLAG